MSEFIITESQIQMRQAASHSNTSDLAMIKTRSLEGRNNLSKFLFDFSKHCAANGICISEYDFVESKIKELHNQLQAKNISTGIKFFFIKKESYKPENKNAPVLFVNSLYENILQEENFNPNEIEKCSLTIRYLADGHNGNAKQEATSVLSGFSLRTGR